MRLAPEGWPFVKVAVALDAALLVIWYSFPGWSLALVGVGVLLTIRTANLRTAATLATPFGF